MIVALVTALCLAGDSMLYIAPADLLARGRPGGALAGRRATVDQPPIRLPFNPLIGRLYKHLALKTGLLLAVVIGVLSTAGYSLASRFPGWLLLRGLWGIGWSFFRIGGLSAVVYCAADHQRGRAMGLYNGLYRLGSLVGMLLGGLLVPVLGLPALALSFAFLALLGLPLLAKGFDLPESPADMRGPPPQRHPPCRQGATLRGLVISSAASATALLIQGGTRRHPERPDRPQLRHRGQPARPGAQRRRDHPGPCAGPGSPGWPGASVPGRMARAGVGAYVAALVGAMGLAFSSRLPILAWLAIALLVMLVATALSTTDALAADVARAGDVVGFMTPLSIVQDLGARARPWPSSCWERPGGFAWVVLERLPGVPGPGVSLLRRADSQTGLLTIR